jgi:hypothetical protein
MGSAAQSAPLELKSVLLGSITTISTPKHAVPLKAHWSEKGRQTARIFRTVYSKTIKPSNSYSVFGRTVCIIHSRLTVGASSCRP